jgi:hypothetical protein
MKNFIYDYLAAQGRKGDSELRNVRGRLSHVNPREARAIDDYGVLGELITQETGAGTMNPYTGFPEYNVGDMFGLGSEVSDILGGEEEEVGGYGGMDWGDYKDMDFSEFAGMSDEDRLAMAQNLGYSGMSQEDIDKYMPEYDYTAEERLREDAARQISGIGEGAQTSLMKAAEAEAGLKSQQGFEATGNPMVDKQRENIFEGIQTASEDAFRTTQRGVSDLREKAMQDWGTRLIEYDDLVSAEDEDEGGGGIMDTAGGIWDKTLGKSGIGGAVGDAWDSGVSFVKGIFSDERLKDNIKFQYVDDIGMPVYSYNYTFDKNTPQLSYMAQDVEKIYPDAVSNSQGFKKVDYSKIIERAKSIGKR